jgi:hypothetical protein
VSWWAGCIFPPYFPSSELHQFTSVHKVFGISNISKLIQVRSFVFRWRWILLCLGFSLPEGNGY